jgi:hypothetical protein
MDTPSSRRIRPPRYQPHPRIAELRAAGWTAPQIAFAIGASLREVTRWAAGDTRPLPVYERLLAALDVAAGPSTTPAS